MLSAFKNLKDKGLSAGLKAWLNEKYKAYGRVENITIDTTARRIILTINLHGENDAIELRLSHYEVQSEIGRVAIRLGRIECSRLWLEAVLNDWADTALKNRAYLVENTHVADLVRALL